MACRILLLTTDLGIGGVPLMVRDLARGLRDLPGKPYQLYAACLGKPDPVADELRSMGIPTTCMHARNAADLAVFARLYHLTRRTGPHLIHSFLVHANLAARLVGMCLDNTSILTTTCTTERQRHWHLWVENFTCRMDDRMLAVSESVARFLQRHAHIPPAHITTIPHGIDVASIANAAPASLDDETDSPGGAPVLCCVGRLDMVKGLDTLIRAFAIVHQQLGAHLLVIGDGPARNHLEQHVRRHDLSECVHLLGFRHDVANLLRACDVYMSASRWEGFGLATAEAMAARIPIVATDTDGTCDLITHMEHGLLVPVDDHTSMAHAVIQLLSSPELRTRLAHNAYLKVSKYFTIEKMVTAHHELYQRLLDNRRR